MTNANTTSGFEQRLQSFTQFNVDDQLALLWFFYTEMAGSLTPAPNDNTTGFAIAKGVVDQIAERPREEQLQAQRDILAGNNGQFTQPYADFNSSNRLAFWYLLAQGMESGTVVPVPSDYNLSSEAQQFLDAFKGYDFESQITFMRNLVSVLGPKDKQGAIA